MDIFDSLQLLISNTVKEIAKNREKQRGQYRLAALVKLRSEEDRLKGKLEAYQELRRLLNA